ncbi:hypothetical protein AB4Z54_18985 [Streptomyces sp. MCAF7]
MRCGDRLYSRSGGAVELAPGGGTGRSAGCRTGAVRVPYGVGLSRPAEAHNEPWGARKGAPEAV